MILSVPMRYDPDVYGGSICHQDLGPHKHTSTGPESFMGFVFAPGEDGMLVSTDSIERVRQSMEPSE